MPWKELGSIKSRTSRHRAYSIDVNDEGELRCSCPAFIHSVAPKWCKHTVSQEAKEMLEKGRWPVTIPTISRYATVYTDGRNHFGVVVLEGQVFQKLEAMYREGLRAIKVGYLTEDLRRAIKKL